jgi:ATP-binding cassette subfamily B protein
LRRADRLVVLERGEVVEVGSHQDLMAARGAYWRLYEAQARNIDAEESSPVPLHIPLTKAASV